MRRRSRGLSRQPKVAVIILNYNGLKWLPRCLSSLIKTRYSNYETFLIDNASSDASVEYVRREYSSVKIVRNSTNLGFTEAYNRAISQIEAEYVVLLNNDTEVLNSRWLTCLLKTASEGANIAAVATKMVSMGNHRLLESVGGAGIPYWRGFFDIGRGETDLGQYLNGFEPFAYCGGAVLIRKSAFIDAGKLDAKFFAHYDDPDLCWRLRLRGWRIGYASGAKVAHHRGGTMGGGEVTPLVLYYCNRNFLRAIIKNCGSSLSWALWNYALYTLLIASGFLIYEPRKSVMLMKGIAWNLRNLSSSCAARQIVQNRRRVGEAEILRRMYPRVTQKQTGKHAVLSRIMNTLFERGGRRKFQTMITSQ